MELDYQIERPFLVQMQSIRHMEPLRFRSQFVEDIAIFSWEKNQETNKKLKAKFKVEL